MRAGRLNKVVSFEQRPTTQVAGGSGDQSATWTVFASGIYAEVVPLSGRELMAAQAVQNMGTSRVRIRYLPGLTAKMRMVMDGLYYNIASPPRDTDLRGREMIFEVEDGLKNG